MIVSVKPHGQSEVAWNMKPGDAVQVQWPTQDLLVMVDEGKVTIAGVERPDGDEALIRLGARRIGLSDEKVDELLGKKETSEAA